MLLHPLSCNHINQGGRWTAIFVSHVLQKGFFLVAVPYSHWVITGHVIARGKSLGALYVKARHAICLWQWLLLAGSGALRFLSDRDIAKTSRPLDKKPL